MEMDSSLPWAGGNAGKRARNTMPAGGSGALCEPLAPDIFGFPPDSDLPATDEFFDHDFAGSAPDNPRAHPSANQQTFFPARNAPDARNPTANHLSSNPNPLLPSFATLQNQSALPGTAHRSSATTHRATSSSFPVASATSSQTLGERIPSLRQELDDFVRGLSPIEDALWLLSDLLDASDPPHDRATAAEQIINFRPSPTSQTSRSAAHRLGQYKNAHLKKLAGVLGLSKTGRKADIVERILDFINHPTNAPVAHREHASYPHSSPLYNNTASSAQAFPASRSAPAGASMSRASHGSTRTAAAAVAAAATSGAGPPQAAGAAAMKSMPMIPSVPRKRPRPGGGLPGGAVGGAGGQGMVASQRIKTGFGSMVDAALAAYDFGTGDSPYNEPVAGPLGVQRFTTLTSNQLDYGAEPSVVFPTPPNHDMHAPENVSCEMQVHLRCLKVEARISPASWKQCWPFPVYAKINGHNVTLNQAQRYTNGKLAGCDSATNITPFLRRFSDHGANDGNQLFLKRQRGVGTSSQGQFVLFVQQIRVKTVERVVQDVQRQTDEHWNTLMSLSNVASPYDADKVKVMELMNQDGLSVAFLKASLRCPLSLVRMATPVKSKFCTHVQCFDLRGYVEYSRKSYKFECPFCNKNVARPQNLISSPYIEAALHQFPNADEIEIMTDGSIREVEQKEGNCSASSDEEEDRKPAIGDLMARRGQSGANGKVNKAQATVVDLTLDSDDDAGPPPTRGTTAPTTAMPGIDTIGLGPPARWPVDIISIDSDTEN